MVSTTEEKNYHQFKFSASNLNASFGIFIAFLMEKDCLKRQSLIAIASFL